jgi:hypothetical protein
MKGLLLAIAAAAALAFWTFNARAASLEIAAESFSPASSTVAVSAILPQH